MDNNTSIDLLQIKIDKAKENLSDETLRSITAVDWKKVILDMRAEKGYSFEQLEDLETETELLLCGISTTDEYMKEIEKRLELSKFQTSELIRELNQKIFSKIREEFIKIVEQKRPTEEKSKSPISIIYDSTKKIVNQKPTESPEKILRDLENEKELPSASKPEEKINTNTGLENKPIFVQKLSVPFKTPVKTTEYTLGNLSKNGATNSASIIPKLQTEQSTKTDTKSNFDPYREIPE